MTNPYLNRKKSKNVGDTGRTSEKNLAKRLGGRQTPASGAVDGAKGDIVLPNSLCEAKSTIKDSIGIQYGWLNKISGEALSQNRFPLLSVVFTTENGNPKPRGSWVMIPEHIFKELTE